MPPRLRPLSTSAGIGVSSSAAPGGGRRFGNTITLCPPLVITRAECDRIVDTLGQALATL